eukprot:PLAT1698.1.p2 GENE.PLAT1698.1~~PLAT1698.1.p2  ORF type:complete len:204 (-),score=81.27 PLAT1698.1:137-748(-)
MMNRLLMVLAFVACCALCVAGRPDLLSVKHQLSRVERSEKEGRRAEAAETLTSVLATLTEWRDALKADPEAAGSSAAEEEEVELPVVPYNMEITHEARKCRRKADKKDTLRIHYVAKLHHSGKVIDSSFHTGSLPVKVEMGSKRTSKCWRKGFVGACEGERRRLTCPSDFLPKKLRAKLPKGSTVVYDAEVTEVGSSWDDDEL